MAIENINAYSERWQNGVSVGAMWDKIKAMFVSGHHDQTSYPANWKKQARTNIGFTTPASGINYSSGEGFLWYGSSDTAVSTVKVTQYSREHLLNAQSDTQVTGLFATKAYRLAQSSVGSASLPIYVDTNGRVATISSLAVNGNVQSLQGGVSAMGIADLFSSVGGGGGGGTVTGVDFTQDVAYQQTGTYTPDDGIIHLPRYKWANIQDKPVVTTGSVNGTISYGGNNVAVYGLQALAYKASLTASDIPTIAISQVNGLQTALNNKLETSLKGAANGLAELDASQKIKLAQIPDVVLGQLVFGGTVNASGVATLSANAKTKTGITSNTVTLSNSAGTSSSYGWVRFEGCFFIMDADSSFASLDLKVGDWLLSTGTAWKKVDNTDAVTGVKGDNESSYRIGNVNITKANIGLGNVENTKLSTWAGTQNITTLGTITTGVWHGTAIANGYLANSTIYINGTLFTLGDSATQDKVTACWGASRDITISDNDGTNTQVTEDVNGANNFTLKLPSTIKATLTGNASSATKLQTSRSIWGQPFNGTAEVSGNMSSVGNIAFNAGDHNIGSLLYFDMTNGRIGIGMSAPLEKLGVQGNMYATGGVAAYGISDLSQSGGGGGGLSGTILRDWSQYDGSAEANQILSSYLGIEQFRMSGQNFQFMRNKTWTTGFTLAEGNIPDLPLTKITGTDDLRAIEALTATSGFLKKTAANTWALATDVVTLAGQQALTNKTYNGYTLADACAKGVVDNSSATALGSNGTNLVTERSVYYGLPTINGGHAYNSGTNIYAPTAVGTDGQILKSVGSGAPSWVNQSTLSVGSAAQLTTARSLWGQIFNGTGDILGDIKLATSGGGANADSAVLRFNGSVSRDVGGPSIRAISGGQNYGRHRLSIFQHNADDYTTENEVMSILVDGRVGIGTTTPSELLHINGNIKGAQLISTQAQGTAPLVVTSTTKVANLNADLLDGYEASGLFESLTNDSDQLKVKIGNTTKLLTLDYAKKSTTLETEPLTNQEFIFRNSPKTIGADSLKLDRILGRTVVWNQQFRGRDTDQSSNGITSSYNSSTGVYQVTGTAANNANGPTFSWTNNTFPNGHKVYTRVIKVSGTMNTLLARIGCQYNTGAGDVAHLYGADAGNGAKIITMNNGYIILQILDLHQGDTINASFKFINIDLTLMFGEAVANTMTVERFEALYLPKYYSYNAGQLINNSAEGLETVGFNLWDEEWEKGVYDNSGQKINDGQAWVRCANYIPVIPNETYYAKTKSSYTLFFYFYDAERNFIYGVSGYDQYNRLAVANSTFVVPANACYIRFFATSGYGDTYTNDICINLSNPNRNGQYEPYKRSVLDLHLDNIQVKSHNIWDEVLENGYYDIDNGQPVSNSSWVRSKNPIKISPNTVFYLYKTGSGSFGYFLYYDVNMNYLGSSVSDSTQANRTHTTPAGCYYMHFYMASTLSVGDICINESSSFNGQYEPHGILTINGLKQAGSVRDEIVGGKFIRRVGSVDLGTLTWNYTGGGSTPYFLSGSVAGIKMITSADVIGNILCGRYTPDKWNVYYDKTIKQPLNNAGLVIVDSGHSSTPTSSDNWLSGVIANYELATYETYELVSPIPTAMPAGTTERRLPEDTSDSVLAPFACDMTYGTNPGDILASGIAWEKIWGRPQLAKGTYSDSVISGSGEWFKLDVGGQVLYVQFAVGTGAFRLKIADSDDEDAATVSKEFAFATLSESDINAICV